METLSLKDDQMLVTNRYGQKMVVIKNDLIGRKIARKGLYDEVGLNFMRFVLEKMERPVMMDIGANIGNHALVLSRYCSQILLFEPQKEVNELLRKNFAINHIDNHRFYDVGLSDEDAELEFFVNLEGNRGASTFNPKVKAQSHKKVRLTVKNGDCLLQAEGVEQVDFIKLDVEGHEYKVLTGLARTIQKFRPVIVMEWNGTILAPKYDALFGGVLSGYRAKAVVSNHSKIYWRSKPLWIIRRFFYHAFAGKSHRFVELEKHASYEQVVLIHEESEFYLQSQSWFKEA